MTRTRPTHLLALLVLLGCATAPGTTPPAEEEGIVCTAQFVYGVEIRAVDAETGEPVTDGLSGTLHEDGWSEEMEASDNVLRGAGERPGTYRVRVTAEGYEPWSRDGIEVPAGVCHVETQRMVAELETRSDRTGALRKDGRSAPAPRALARRTGPPAAS